ncbi:hypothetical protein B0J13DRAFT_528540 [Dactylonectria estremocensis]|uniref:Uncharacterized protein n=1 Tax=Dactylonectria estremocensis TaxID=1079267 RepID=A0A9P9EEX6_9HYPO|nr:hypothetical protein B0J13DRAFT_528540 [Dactylonectria estremocensis]
MRFINLAMLALLSASGIAYEVIIYNDVDNCEAGDLTVYRSITGAATGGDGPGVGACYTFDEPMPGTDCEQFTNGGWAGPMACDSRSLLPQSSFVKNQGRPCLFYEEPDCNSASSAVWDGCITAKVRSFRCDIHQWDGTVDILGNVGCSNGVSTNVCVNDCQCQCAGQNLVCPNPDDPEDMPAQCNYAALALCRNQCSCFNPCLLRQQEADLPALQRVLEH